MEDVKLLYRTLNTQDHIDRWERGEFHGFHHDPPGEWWICWNESKSATLEDYPLQTSLGILQRRLGEPS
jgi:hypothetical protein